MRLCFGWVLREGLLLNWVFIEKDNDRQQRVK
jgi:hypothetical protein